MNKVFRFDTAFIKDAVGAHDFVSIIEANRDEHILLLISCLGDTRSVLEKLTESYFKGGNDRHAIFENVKDFHENIAATLFGNTTDPVFDEIANTLIEIDWMLEEEPHPEYDFNYDQMVSVGELLSSKIMAAYLNRCGFNTRWIDARGYIHTDNNYRDATVDLEKSYSSINELQSVVKSQLILTQNSIGGTSENFTTTLGSSNLSATIFAKGLQAESVTIWQSSNNEHSKDQVGMDSEIPIFIKSLKREK